MILLDTQAIVWLALRPDLLSGPAVRAIETARSEDGIAISDKTLWEIAMMVSRRKIEVKGPLIDFLRAVEEAATVFPIDSAVADGSLCFGADFPKDPSDRIIAATAIVHGLSLVTSDEAIRRSGEVPCIW